MQMDFDGDSIKEVVGEEQMSDLFSDVWDFAPNSTFTDLTDPSAPGQPPAFAVPDGEGEVEVKVNGQRGSEWERENGGNYINNCRKDHEQLSGVRTTLYGGNPTSGTLLIHPSHNPSGSLRSGGTGGETLISNNRDSIISNPSISCAFPNVESISGSSSTNAHNMLDDNSVMSCKEGMPSPRVKSKGPNLYDTLRNPALLGAPMMMPISPFAALSEGGIIGTTGMEWSPQLLATSPLLDMNAATTAAVTGVAGIPSTATANGTGVPATSIFPTSPQMLTTTDVNGQSYMLVAANRLKRPYMSPYFGSADSLTSMGLMATPYGLYARPARPAKMPLTPLCKAERTIGETGEDRTMPLILPISGELKQQPNAPSTNNSSSNGMANRFARTPTPNPIVENITIGQNGTNSTKHNHGNSPALAPTTTITTSLHESFPTTDSPSLDANIERNLRSFLRDTQDLAWDNVTVLELKRILRQYELNATGKKAELMQRIAKIRHSYKHLQQEPSQAGSGAKHAQEDAGSSPDTMGSDQSNYHPTLADDPIDALFSQSFKDTNTGPSASLSHARFTLPLTN